MAQEIQSRPPAPGPRHARTRTGNNLENSLKSGPASGGFTRRQAFEAFNASLETLSPGQLAIDLGANVGVYTEKFAATGADVIAFEPDPHAFSRLEARVGALPNVTLIEAAVGTRNGTAELYRHVDFDKARDKRSESSSLLATKRKLDANKSLTVHTVDFITFLNDLDRDVTVLKMDIEGSEVPLMEALLDCSGFSRVDRVFIESHERKIPSLAARTRALKARTSLLQSSTVNWDWH